MTVDEKLDLILTKVSGIETRMIGIEDRMSGMENKLNETFDELMLVEKIALDNQEQIKALNEKYDTLLLKADNTDLLLRLINRQADELDSLKARIEMLEKKIS